MKIKCPKCGSAKIRLAPTTPKALSQCFECGNIWRQVYKPRKKANAKICKKSANPQLNTANMTNLAKKTDKNGKNQEISDHAVIAVDWAFNGGKPTIPFAIESAIVDALDHAKTKHPHFADSNAEAGTVIAEELLEVNTAALKVMQSINDQADRDNLFVELCQLNATTIRMMEKLLK